MAFDGTDMEDESVSDYGEVKAFYKKWGGENLIGTSYAEIDTHLCSSKELGIGQGSEDSESRFWPLQDRSKGYVNYYRNLFFCIDDDLEIRGDYNSDSVQHLALMFVACDSSVRSTCKSQEEIR